MVATSTIQQVITEGHRLQYLNRHADAGRCGLILSGPARTGKTTCLAQLGKTIETIHHRRHPHAAGHIPVIYITAPPAATPRMIAVEFARFLGLPLTRRSNVTDVLEAVCGVCLDAATTLVCVDEIHNVNLGTRHGAEASDTLKYFAERLPVTFVYAGISVERAGLLSGTRGEQIAGRFSMIRTGPFGRGQQWQALIAALEGSLRLHRHRDGTLVELPLPARPQRRDDRQPAAPGPRRRHPGRPRRHRGHHQGDAGIDPGRHRLRRRAPAQMIPEQDARQAITLAGQGANVSEIARRLGHDRKTIRIYLNGHRAPGQPRPHADSFAPFAAYIRQRAQDDRHLRAPACTARSPPSATPAATPRSPANCAATASAPPAEPAGRGSPSPRPAAAPRAAPVPHRPGRRRDDRLLPVAHRHRQPPAGQRHHRLPPVLVRRPCCRLRRPRRHRPAAARGYRHLAALTGISETALRHALPALAAPATAAARPSAPRLPAGAAPPGPGSAARSRSTSPRTSGPAYGTAPGSAAPSKSTSPPPRTSSAPASALPASPGSTASPGSCSPRPPRASRRPRRPQPARPAARCGARLI